ncbi:hypothetical protein GCM10022254_47510 [Actinomadura meridiana]|uniref:Aldehyde dehydrogenase domain-containing protein n=1 Tax=Actinomadura meridiana TaxID=559626 RepID=A0ABP8CBL4_9ACTN
MGAGNAVVHKPDTQACLSSLWVVDLLVELGLPKDLWQVVVGEPSEIGDALVENADYVAFTGSTRAGRAIAEKVAPRLVGYSLELGGKNPMIVMADADVERTARGAVRACFTNAGQLCISIERMYVHEDVYDRFVPRRPVEVHRVADGRQPAPPRPRTPGRHGLRPVRRPDGVRSQDHEETADQVVGVAL